MHVAEAVGRGMSPDSPASRRAQQAVEASGSEGRWATQSMKSCDESTVQCLLPGDHICLPLYRIMHSYGCLDLQLVNLSSGPTPIVSLLRRQTMALAKWEMALSSSLGKLLASAGRKKKTSCPCRGKSRWLELCAHRIRAEESWMVVIRGIFREQCCPCSFFG